MAIVWISKKSPLSLSNILFFTSNNQPPIIRLLSTETNDRLGHLRKSQLLIAAFGQRSQSPQLLVKMYKITGGKYSGTKSVEWMVGLGEMEQIQNLNIFT